MLHLSLSVHWRGNHDLPYCFCPSKPVISYDRYATRSSQWCGASTSNITCLAYCIIPTSCCSFFSRKGKRGPNCTQRGFNPWREKEHRILNKTNDLLFFVLSIPDYELVLFLEAFSCDYRMGWFRSVVWFLRHLQWWYLWDQDIHTILKNNSGRYCLFIWIIDHANRKLRWSKIYRGVYVPIENKCYLCILFMLISNGMFLCL